MKKSTRKVTLFILYNVIFISFAFYIAYHVQLKYNKNPVDFMTWFNAGNITPGGLFISLVFGIVFGFLDNFFLWMGVDRMMEFIPGGTLTKGAWGNTYSDFMGATIGASIASIASDFFNIDPSPPIWINAIAMPIGCIIGMYTGKMITGSN